MKKGIKAILFMLISVFFISLQTSEVKAEAIENRVVCVGQTETRSYSNTLFTTASVESSDENVVIATIKSRSVTIVNGMTYYITSINFRGVSAGTATITLSNSGLILGSVEITVQEHTWDSGIVTEVLTDSGKGTKKYTCTNCGITRQDEISIELPPDIVAETEKISGCIGKKKNSSNFELSDDISNYTIVNSDEYIGEAEIVQGEENSYTLSFAPLSIGSTEVFMVDKEDSIVKIFNFTVTDHIEVVDEEAVEPTCTTDGLMGISHCSECGTRIKSNDVIKALGHKCINYVSDDNATCTKDGTKTAVCENGCGLKDTIIIEGSKLGHKCINYVSDDNATCTKDGTKTAVCENGCGLKDTIVIRGSKKGHNVVTASAIMATCTEDGKTEGSYCSVCGVELVRQYRIPEIGHSWDDGLITKAPTILSEGEKTYTCSICKAVKSEVIPKLAASSDNNLSEDNKKDGNSGTITLTTDKTKKSQQIKVATKKTVSVKKVKKKAISFKLSAKATSGSKVKYKLVKKNNNIKFSAVSGKVTVKKGTKKGTYTIKVKMMVSENDKYNANSATKTIIIKVK